MNATATPPLRELSLYSGAGGGVWGSKLLGWQTVGYVEYDEYCQKVIRQRIDDGLFDRAPIFSDVRTFADIAHRFRGVVDVITAGFPCQAFSSAARGRHVEPNLWPTTFKVIDAVRPQYVLLENVVNAKAVMDRAGEELGGIGYWSRAITLSASDLGAPYAGARVWLLAETDTDGESAEPLHAKVGIVRQTSSPIWKEVEPSSLGMADGMAARLKRLNTVGNGQIPRMVVEAWKVLSSVKKEKGA